MQINSVEDSDSEMLLTGGGNIREVDLEDPAEITFNVCIHIYSECCDELGIACVKCGYKLNDESCRHIQLKFPSIHFNFFL